MSKIVRFRYFCMTAASELVEIGKVAVRYSPLEIVIFGRTSPLGNHPPKLEFESSKYEG